MLITGAEGSMGPENAIKSAVAQKAIFGDANVLEYIREGKLSIDIADP
jgi:hypothetical protein